MMQSNIDNTSLLLWTWAETKCTSDVRRQSSKYSISYNLNNHWCWWGQYISLQGLSLDRSSASVTWGFKILFLTVEWLMISDITRNRDDRPFGVVFGWWPQPTRNPDPRLCVCVCVWEREREWCAAHHKVVRRLLSFQQSSQRRHLNPCSALWRRELRAEIVSLTATNLIFFYRKIPTKFRRYVIISVLPSVLFLSTILIH